MGMFRKILIANRGEIAVRIIRTARAMGIATVAVYSEADARAMHVARADEAYGIGPAPARESYLRADAIIDAALRAGAEAIHPGYGFLSENADFAEAVGAAGLIFIGPPPAAIRAMGGKAQSKALMAQAGVPLVPGYHGAEQGPAFLAAQADEIGYPVLIKASAGGGGRGMRVVEAQADFVPALESAKREAASSFGDARVLLEKYVSRPRHVEMQIFADRHGNAVHLFERDCSIQRRHQKIIEEAPAPDLNPVIRHRMADAAIAAAQAVGYEGAGTVEFLLDETQDFYFMEMNTRLQVEHPVTEFITGLDLVEWQLRIAAGERLPLLQEDIHPRGHAIEVRICAEDPAQDFRPAAGPLRHLAMPLEDASLRIDTGVREGDIIGVHYDPMIAKLIAYGPDRASALQKLRYALAATQIAGLASNVAYLSAIAAHPAFAAAALDTGFLPRHEADLNHQPKLGRDTTLLAALGVLLTRQPQTAPTDPHSPWAQPTGWRLNEPAIETLKLRHGETELGITFRYTSAGFVFLHEGAEIAAAGHLTPTGALHATLDGQALHAGFTLQAGAIDLFQAGAHFHLALAQDAALDEAEGPAGGLTAPMPGTITALSVAQGAPVAKGDRLLVMEAMKMEFTLSAPADGVVDKFFFAPGEMVEEGTTLLAFTPA